MAETGYVAHKSIGISVDADLEKLEKASKLFEKMDSQINKLKKAANGTKSNFFDDMASKSEKVTKSVDSISKHTSDMARKGIEDANRFSHAWSTATTDRVFKLAAKVNTDQIEHAKNEAQKLSDIKPVIEAKYKSNVGEQTEHDQSLVRNFSDKAKDYFKSLGTSIGTGLGGGFDKAKSKLGELKGQAEHTRGLFSRIVTSTLISNGVMNSWYALTGQIKNATKAGLDYDKMQQQMLATWTTLSGSEQKAAQMRSRINKYSVETGQDTDLVNEEEQGFYHLHSNTKESNTMTHAMLNMTDAVGLSKQQAGAVSQDMVHTLSGGVVQTGDLNTIGQYFPMFNDALEKYEAKIHHVSEVSGKDLRAMAKAGTISAKDYEAVFEELGNKKYGSAAERMLTTFNGMERTIKARVPALMGEVEKPFLTQESGLYGAMSKWVSAGKTEKEFTALGKALNTSVKQIAKAFAQVFNIKSVPNAMDSMIQRLTRSVKSFGDYMSQPKTIRNVKAFFDSFKAAGATTIKVYAQALKDLMPLLDAFGKFAAAHPKLVGNMVAGMFLLNGATKLYDKTLVGLFSAAKLVTTPLKGLWGVVKLFNHGESPKAITSLITSLKSLRSISGIKSMLTGIGSTTASIFKTGGKSGMFASLTKGAWSTGLVGKMATVGAGAATAFSSAFDIYKAFKSKNKETKFEEAGKGIGTAVGGGIGMFFGGPAGAAIGSTIGSFAGKWGGAAAKQMTDGWNKAGRGMKAPTGFLPKTGYYARKGADAMVSWGKSVGKWASKNKGSLLLTLANPFLGIVSFLGKTKIGKSIGNWVSGLFSKASKAAKSAGNKVGKMIAAPFLFGVGLIHRYLVKPLRKPIEESFSWISKKFNSFKKTIGSLWRSATKPVVNLWKSVWNTDKKLWNSFSSWVGKSFNAAGKKFSSLWRAATKPISNLWKSTWGDVKKLWNNFSSWIGKEWNGFAKDSSNSWNDFEKAASDKFTAIGKAIAKPFKDAWNFISNIFSKIGNLVSKPIKGLGKWVASVTREGSRTIKGHATGGRITSNHLALVGEKGMELAYSKRGSRLLGVHGAQLTTVLAGEHIFPANDTRKLLTRGLDISNFASGTDRLSKTNRAANISIGSGGNLGKSVKSQFDRVSKMTNAFKRQNKAVFSNVGSDSTNPIKKASKAIQRSYKQTYSGVNGTTNNLRRNQKSQFTSLFKSLSSMNNQMSKKTIDKMSDLKSSLISITNSTSKQWKSIWSDMVSYFGDVMSKLKPYAHSAMAGAISQLNGGFSGIDSALSQFGGNKQVLKPIHYATGTNGKIPNNQMAILNDADSGPRQEAIVDPNGKVSAVHGRNTLHLLEKGSQVLNGRQFNEFIGMGGVAHYAKGSGISKGNLEKIVENSKKNIPASWQSLYKSHINPKGSTLESGISSSGRDGAGRVGMPWLLAAWSVISSITGGGGGGSRKRFLDYAEQHFTGKRYVMGGTGPDVYDCSGMVSTALKHFGIDAGRTTTAMQHSSSLERLGRSYHLAEPGDLYLFGHGNGAAGHVGIVKNPRTGSMFNETPPRARVTNINDVTSVSHDGVYRVKGLHDEAKGKDQKADPRLEKLFRAQLGKSAIKKLHSMFDEDDGGGSFKLGGDIGDRARTLAKAIKSMYGPANNAGIAAVLGNWEFESRLDPNAVNPGGGASGLGQWLGGRKTALINYARRHGKNWKNAGTQLSFALNGDGSDSSILKSILRGSGSVASLANRFSSEWERGGYNAQHVEGARQIEAALHNSGGWSKKGKLNIFGEKDSEVVINPKMDNSDSLIASAMTARAGLKPSSVMGRLVEISKGVESRKNNRQVYGSLMGTIRGAIRHDNAKAMPNIVVSPTFNFYAPVSKETADYATGKMTSSLKRLINEEINKYVKEAHAQLDS